jgi:nitrogen fixation/metabolism regulation signal transduction histidine kinase
VLMLLTSLSLIVLLVVFYHQTEKRLYNEFARQTTELTKAVQLGLEGTVGGNLSDGKNLEGYLQGLNPKGVKEVSVISSSNRIIASTDQENVGKWITQQRKELIFKADLGEPVTGEGQIFNVIVPVVANGSTAGYIHLTLNTEDFSVLLRLSAVRRILAAFLVLSLGTVVTVVLARYYTRPIVAMATAAGHVAAGDFNQHLPVERRDEIGQLARSFNGMIDRLSEDRQLRERLRTAEHLASAGQFARHIAHEIKNPLNFISLSIDHMGDTYRPADVAAAERFDSMVSNLKGEVGRIGRFAESFLEYGRPFELRVRSCDIGQMLSEVLELVAARARTCGMRIVRDTERLPVLQADPEFLRTCLYNIVSNAFEAMSAGGTLTVRGTVEDAHLVLVFEDTGEGVAPENFDKLFTPLFSTKQGGLGLGLALTRRVIEEHGGKVQFHSQLGQGSKVTIMLPLSEEGP